MTMYSDSLWDGSVWDTLAKILSPDAMFTVGQPYGWAIVAPNTVWADTAGTTPGVVDATIRRLDDQRGAPWIGVTTGPTFRNTGGVYWLEFAQTDGRQLQITVPAITNGTLMIAYKNAGVMSGDVTIPAGPYTIGRWDSDGIVGVLLINRNLSQSEREQVRQWFITERGAGSFSTVTSFMRFGREQNLTSVDTFDTSSGTNFYEFLAQNLLTSVPLFNTSNGTIFSYFLRNNALTSVPLFNTSNGTSLVSFLQQNQLTSVPLFDTSKGADFNSFLRANQLTSVPLFDTSKGTDFNSFLRANQLTSVPLFNTASGTDFNSFLRANQLTSVPLFNTASGTNFQDFLRDNPLANVPAGLFDNVKGTNFTNVFLNCALTQPSIDNVLVSIATAAAANNLNNGTLTGLNSGTNSAPSATGVAAKNALIARGWTVSTF